MNGDNISLNPNKLDLLWTEILLEKMNKTGIFALEVTRNEM